MAEVKLIRDHHLLTRNLRLNDNYISNDGGDEGITVSDGGTISIEPADSSKSAISINHDYEDTTAASDIATLKIDFDQGTTTSNNMTSKGIELNMLYGSSTGGVNVMYGAHIYCQHSSASGLASNQTFGLYSKVLGNQNAASDLLTAGIFIATGGDTNTGVDITADDGGEDLIIRSSAQNDDWFKLQVEANGLTTLSTQEYGGGSNAHLNIVPDGNVGIGVADPDSALEILSTSDQLKLSYDADDYFKIVVAANGATTLTTFDNDGVLGNLTLDVDGDIILDADGGDVIIKDGGTEVGRFNYSIAVGEGNKHFTLQASTPAHNDLILKSTASDGDVILDSQTGIIQFRVDSDEDDLCTLTVAADGVTTIATVDSDGAVGHLNIEADGHVEFDGCAAGFDRISGVFDGTNSTVDFRTGNKAYLDCTGAGITNLKMIFPDVSGNFVLLINHPASGCNITNYLAYDGGGGAAEGDTDVKWAGGTAPTLTNDEDHVDILSFFWDADSETAYGVASLDFQN